MQLTDRCRKPNPQVALHTDQSLTIQSNAAHGLRKQDLDVLTRLADSTLAQAVRSSLVANELPVRLSCSQVKTRDCVPGPHCTLQFPHSPACT